MAIADWAARECHDCQVRRSDVALGVELADPEVSNAGFTFYTTDYGMVVSVQSALWQSKQGQRRYDEILRRAIGSILAACAEASADASYSCSGRWRSRLCL